MLSNLHRIKYLITLLAIVLVFGSCSIEKRQHLSGFHVQFMHVSQSKQQVSVSPIKHLVELDGKKYQATTKVSSPKPLLLEPTVDLISNKVNREKIRGKSSQANFTIKKPADKSKETNLKPPKLKDDDEMKLEWNGVIALALVALPLLFWQLFSNGLLSGSGNEIVLFFSPVFAFFSIALASYSLGKIKEKPYLYYGAMFGIAALIIMLGLIALFYVYYIKSQ